MNSSSLVVATVVGLGIGTITISWIIYCQRKKRCLQHPDSTQWQHIGTLKEINLFPVKSSAAVQLEQAECNKFGLSWLGFRDRRILLMTDDGKMCFADAYSLMLSVQSELLSEAVIRLTAPNAEPLTLDLNALISEGVIMEKPMQGYRYQLVECKTEHHVWFSQAILKCENGMRLYIALDPIIDTPWWRNTKHDLVPIMAMHDKSLHELNSRLSVQNRAHHHQFRGNLLIESSVERVEAFDEDNWLWCRIGNDSNATILRFIAPCLRCIMINVDASTCQRNPNFEPLKTLKKFRLRSHPVEPEMGVYFDLYKMGMVRKGDPVYVQYKTGKF